MGEKMKIHEEHLKRFKELQEKKNTHGHAKATLHSSPSSKHTAQDGPGHNPRDHQHHRAKVHKPAQNVHRAAGVDMEEKQWCGFGGDASLADVGDLAGTLI